jgi:hypothetical protein
MSRFLSVSVASRRKAAKNVKLIHCITSASIDEKCSAVEMQNEFHSQVICQSERLCFLNVDYYYFFVVFLFRPVSCAHIRHLFLSLNLVLSMASMVFLGDPHPYCELAASSFSSLLLILIRSCVKLNLVIVLGTTNHSQV